MLSESEPTLRLIQGGVSGLENELTTGLYSVKVVRSPLGRTVSDTGTTIIGRSQGVSITIETDGKTVHEERVYPVFTSIRDRFGIEVKKPFYDERIVLAQNRALRIASKL